MTASARAPRPDDGAAGRLPALLRAASLEVPARTRASDACREFLAPGTTVHIRHAAGDTTQGLVGTAVRLARAGFVPVPHVAARALESFTRLNDYLAHLVGEAGVVDLLVTAGDQAQPVGPYRTSLDLLETGLLEKHGVRRVGIAGYPERHPAIATSALEAARAAKLARLRRGGFEPYIVTQLCLDARPIASWLAATRAAGLDCAIRVGLAGPATVATLAKFAVRCGVGLSLRSLARGQTSVARLTREAGPESILRALALAEVPLDGLHFFSFGGVARTAAWLAAAARGDFPL